MQPETTPRPSPGEPAAPLLTVAEAAAEARVARATVYGAVATGQLACFRIRSRPGTRGAIRISREQLRAWLEGCANPATGRAGRLSRPASPGGVFTELDQSRLLDAWRRQGVLAGRTGGGSARSSG
jgi:excisionase family DNA binding protein